MMCTKNTAVLPNVPMGVAHASTVLLSLVAVCVRLIFEKI